MFDCYVLIDQSDDDYRVIVGVYTTLDKAKAARPNAEWREQDDWDRKENRWQSKYLVYCIERHDLDA